VLAKRKDMKEAAARAQYKRELVIERLTGNTYDHYVSPYMEWGQQQEKFAREEFTLRTGLPVTKIGLAYHPDIKWYSASTDGLVGDDAILEIKCLTPMSHLDILMSGEIPADYHEQMLGGMDCTERSKCYFVSYDPRFPEPQQMFIKLFERQDAVIRGMRLEVTQFLSEVEEMLVKVKESNREALQESIA
jgi:putative phage-type endonuclease